MGLQPKGACKPRAPGAKRPCRLWQPLGALLPQKCAALFLISNRLIACSKRETNNVQAADEALDIAKSNFAAGLGTQLDILQAASDVTRTRTTRLSAIYLHNVGPCPSGARLRGFGGSARLRIKHPKSEERKTQCGASLPTSRAHQTN